MLFLDVVIPCYTIQWGYSHTDSDCARDVIHSCPGPLGLHVGDTNW